jgi:GrpB-like predicted nucleotidyltransferase (UPF0157 family)
VTSRIEIVPYDEAWPSEFEALHARLTDALGDVALRVEHVGSTAVPGLPAKPKIDADVVIRSQTDLPVAIERLAAIGFEHQGDLGVTGREAFRGPDLGEKYHVYVCVEDSEPLRAHLAFRDYLRASPETASAYARLKRDLARDFRDDRDSYTVAKTTFVRDVVERAQAGRHDMRLNSL